MRSLKTKSRKQKRFPFREEKNVTICLWDVDCNNWYLHDGVEANCLGMFAYHWFLRGYFTVFVFDSGFPIMSFKTEKEAKMFIKKLYLTDGIDPTELKAKYNPEEDIPF